MLALIAGSLVAVSEIHATANQLDSEELAMKRLLVYTVVRNLDPQ
jgi:hypothetical protein